MLANTEEYCAAVLEDIVRASFGTDSRYAFTGKLPTDRPLDATYVFDKSRIGVEVKNHREWIYPITGEVWQMIAKCLALDALPVLVAREIGYLTRAVFAQLGIMGFAFHRQVFHPDFIQSALPATLGANRTKWAQRRPLLEEFAITRNLGSKNMKDTDRQEHRAEFMGALFGHAVEEQY